jgi:hypothetical protein
MFDNIVRHRHSVARQQPVDSELAKASKGCEKPGKTVLSAAARSSASRFTASRW